MNERAKATGEPLETAPGKPSPAVTVVMPAHNDEEYVAEAIESILNQTFSDFELIIVDDGSTDGSPAVIDRYAAEDPRVRVIRNEHPTGRGAARNAGIDQAAAPLIAFQDSDDLSLPRRLELHTRHLAEHPDLDAVFSGNTFVEEDGTHIGTKRLDFGPEELRLRLRNSCAIGHWAALYRTEVIRSIGGYRNGFRQSQDYDMLLRLIESARIDVLPGPVYAYRKNRTACSVAGTGREFELLARRFAEQRAAAGHDDYETVIAEGGMPEAAPESRVARTEEYHYSVARLALRCGEYRSVVRHAARGCRANPRFLPRFAVLLGGVAFHAALRAVGLLAWFEKKYRVR